MKSPTPDKITVEQLATVISKSYAEPVTVQDIRAAIEAGAPTNRDGTINLLKFVAWLLLVTK